MTPRSRYASQGLDLWMKMFPSLLRWPLNQNHNSVKAGSRGIEIPSRTSDVVCVEGVVVKNGSHRIEIKKYAKTGVLR